MYDYITPQKVINALRWLKANNPLYVNVKINDEWLEQSMANDEELFTSFIEQTDTSSMDSEPTQALDGSSSGNCTNNNCEPCNTDVTTPTMDTDCDLSMECFPYSLPGNRPFTVASTA